MEGFRRTDEPRLETLARKIPSMVDAEKEKARARGRELAADYASRGDAVGWFDAFYEEAAGDISKVSWADLEPNRFFNAWAESRDLEGGGKRALVVGCGLGDDARYLHDLGFDVTAFDISPTAIEWAKRLHEGAGIAFFVADLLNAPPEWQQAFDFVLEIYTIQPLPMELRPKVIDAIASFVAPQGRLCAAAAVTMRKLSKCLGHYPERTFQGSKKRVWRRSFLTRSGTRRKSKRSLS